MLTVTIFVLATAAVLVAQTSAGSQTGKLKGTVTDSSHAPMAKVKIVVESDSLRREVVSDERGNYEIELSLGTYRLTAMKEGYRPPKLKKIRVPANAVMTRDIMFPPIYTNADPNPFRNRFSFQGRGPTNRCTRAESAGLSSTTCP
jgi:hypothetical protein